MSGNESAAWARWTVGQRRLAGTACLVLAALSLFHYLGDLRLRDPAERFVRNFSVDRRHPFEVAAMRLEPSGDLACAMAVDAALRETPKAPPEELMEARGLMLRALGVRPGWPFHAYLLGRTAAGLSAHSDGGDPPSRPDRWAVPLRVAARAAP
ncbi:MAG: hypothetical protein M3R34_06115, partial [Acidobacteriota bacterium]|nr:hypothetical protein [Acidobacteriota bacterium]